MTTSTKARTSRTSTAAKAKATPDTPKAEVAKTEPTPVAKTEPTPKAEKSTSRPYRDNDDFAPALKAVKSLSKGNPDLSQPVQLITHLGWKTPTASVGWAKGTTANVIAYADDIAVPTGTPVAEAMSVALSAAAKGAKDEAQKAAVAALTTVVKSHK